MKQILKMALLGSALLLSSLVMAEDTATAAAKVDVVIAKGKVGQAPVQVVYDYLADRISDEYGVGEYQNLHISQKAAGAEDFHQVALEVVQSGLMDDAIASQRYRFVLSVNEEAKVWQIKSVTQDWQCRRGHKKAWTQKPCK
ncbi:hypothetical protein ABHF33_01600 [Chitinibacter sp. FCG-7]|uniref:Uncharacterized protein n=1 Tax=Chitinibacter mangrovi TaxID=3153927 RepID=A0AAU7FAC6_9NEIS